MNPLTGLLFASLLSILALPKLMDLQQKGLDNTKIAATAQQAKQIADAAQLYVAANATAIAAVATPSTPATITVAMLQCSAPTAGCPAIPYLSTAISNSNPYGQTWVAETLQPTPGQLQTVIFSRGAATIPATHLARIAMLASSPAGAQGGFVPYTNQFGPTTDTTAAQGANWSLSLANYTQDGPGHLASRLDYNSITQTNTYLNRNAVPGNPTLNTMNTSLNMGGNNITGASGISATTITATGDLSARTLTPTLVVADGSSCAGFPSGAQAQSSITSGLALSCQSGVWAESVKKAAKWVNMALRSGGWIAMVDPVTAEPYSSCYTAYAGVSVAQYPAGAALNYYNYFTGAYLGVQIATKPTWAYNNSTGAWLPVGATCAY